MESSCIKRLCTNERFVFRQEADCWRSKLIHSVGLDVLKVFSGTAVLKDLSRLKDCKPASVSNWSFDENCLFCCLRREKVKEHVVTLNRQIVESGGKPLLGKDPSNISRLEWHSEEFLNAVLHRTEYKPRIPDPHIPVVACGVMQQMINELATYYTSSNNCTQDALQDDGTQDQSLLKTSCDTANAAVDMMSAQSAFVMVDQDAPLDLSVKKVKVENIEQDGVLDLSTKKSSNKGHTSLKKSHVHVSLATHLVKRDSGALTEDLQSASTLEQFMSRLCLHHQRQIVDALGFLQSEVKTVATSNNFQTLSPSLSEKPAASCSRVTRPEIQRTGKTCSLEAGVSMTKPHESSDLSSTACVTSEKPVDLCNIDVLSSSSSYSSGTECANASSPTKSLIVSKTTTDPLEVQKALDSSIKPIDSNDSVKTSLCSAEKSLPTCTSESDQAELLSKQTNSFAQTDDAVPSTIQKTSNVVLSASPRTARKSRKGSCHRPMNGSLSCIISDADSHCDLVYIRKSITECQPQSHCRLQPRRNARKSTRGHKYVEEYLELKTVRTLASSKSILDATGNCPARMPDMLTLVSPKQILSSVPLVNPPFAGDCVKNVIEQFSSEQIAEDEMPGDVVEVTGASLTVETSQTDKIEATTQISHEPSCEESELINQPDVITDAPSSSPNAVEQEENMEVEEVGDATEVTELAVQREECDAQNSPVEEEEVCGTESKAVCEEESLEPSKSPVPLNMAEDLPTDEADVDQSHQKATESPTEAETAADAQKQPEESGMNANAEENGPAQEQDLPDTESNLQTVNSSKLPADTQVDSSLTDVSAVQPLVKCKKDSGAHTPKVSNAKQPVPSDRCLRSRVSKGSLDVMKDSVKCAASDAHADDSSLKTQSEKNAQTEDKHDSDLLETGEVLVAAKPSSGLVVDHAIKTGPTSGTAPALESNPDLNVNDEVPREVLPDTEKPSGEPSNEASESTEKITLRNKSSPVEVSGSGDCSPVKKPSPKHENMLLRSRRNTEQSLSSKLNSPTEGHPETQTPPTRSSSGSARDVCSSPEGVTRMPLRSRTIGTTKPTVTADPVTADPPAQDSVKSSVGEQPFTSDSSSSCKKEDSGGHMPLRSSASVASEQPCNTRSAAVATLDSPGRMSLRRGPTSNMEPMTPPKSKRPLRIQRVSASSSVEAEEKPVTSKLKVQPQKHEEAQISPNLGDESKRIAGLHKSPPVATKFLEALRGEENQQLISSLNTKFDRMHKGWVQMDKEGQPAPKHKNKADRLKEIWKSKRRVRKSRPLEQQRFSPVQMLFMKPFDLSSICRWFLQSTETKSLVIVKKVNTRLPSETQLCFHTSAAGAAAAHGIFPSLQAERLKKHLKKFAIASPVKNTPKNQKLLSKALGQGLPVMRSREKPEPTTATRICTKAQSLAGVSPSPAPESLGAISEKPGKNPASARILRKYSNMREKLQVQQSKKCKEKTFKGARLKAAIIPKKAGEQKLQTRKEAKSTVVQKISSLSKVAKASSALKQRVLKRNKDKGSTKSLKRLPKASANTLRKTLIQTASERLKASRTKAKAKKPLLQKGPQSLEPQALEADSKPPEDQVLTRSQRKMEGVPPQTHSSPKVATKRSSEPLVMPTKRTRTSKS